MMSRRTRQILLRLLTYVMLAALAALFLFPFYWLLISAFKAKDQIFALPPQWWPSPWRFVNFASTFEKTNIVRAFFNSTVIAAGHCTLALFLCSLAGFAFAKYPQAPGRDKLFAFVLATMMIPGAVTLIPVFVVLCKLHAVNTYWAMIVPGAASAFGIFWMRQYAAENIHNDLLDAALGILLVIGSWNNLMWAFIVLRTKNMFTLPLLIYLLNCENRTPFELIMAASLLATLPLVAAFLLFQRQFIQGITAGAIKG